MSEHGGGELILYDYPISYNCQIVRLVLCEKEIGGTAKRVDIGPMMENFQPWFMQLNPKGLVPVIEHNGGVVTETHDIIRYLDRNFGGTKLTPESESERAEMDEWLDLERSFPEGDFTYGLVEQGTGKIVAKDMERRKKLLNEHMQANPELSGAYQAKIEDIVQWQERLSEPDIVDRLVEDLQTTLDKFEEHIGEREFIVGTQYTLADAAWTALFGRLEMLGFKRMWSFGARPNIEEYYIRMKRRPSFHRAPIYLKSSLGLVISSAIKAFWKQIAIAGAVIAAIIVAVALL